MKKDGANTAGRPVGGPLWAITTYFNSTGLANRRDNYRRFRQRMALPLLTVELAYGDAPFALAEDEADILIRVRGGDIMWQKERLLDLALERLPESCRYVAWIDCDVVFDRPDWPELALRSLERFQLVQLFDAVHYLGRDAGDRPLDLTDTYATRVAMAAAVIRGADPVELFAEGDRRAVASTTPGFAWATPRETIERCRFLDTCVIGGGDRAMIAAVYGAEDHVIARQRMTAAHAESYRTWAAVFREAVGGAVGSIPGDLFHCWHGAVEKRRMRERYYEIAPFALDPARDIGRAECGAWQWISDKPGLHDVVRRQFLTRYVDA